MPDEIQIQSRDYWVKYDVWLTWVLIDRADDGIVRVYFINDTLENDAGEIFGELTFPSTEAALEALRRNRLPLCGKNAYAVV
jgi:hypothetical protein